MLEEEVRRLPRQRISSLMGPLSVRMAFAVPDDTGHFTEGIAGKPVINKAETPSPKPNSTSSAQSWKMLTTSWRTRSGSFGLFNTPQRTRRCGQQSPSAIAPPSSQT